MALKFLGLPPSVTGTTISWATEIPTLKAAGKTPQKLYQQPMLWAIEMCSARLPIKWDKIPSLL